MKPFRKHNEALFLRLLAALVLLAALPGAVIGYIVYNINHADHMEHVSTLMNSLAADRELMTRLIMEKQRDGLVYLAKDPKIAYMARALSAGRPSPDPLLLERMVNRSPFFASLALIDLRSGATKAAGAFPGDFLEKSRHEIMLGQGKPFVRPEVLAGGRRVLFISQPVDGWGQGRAALLGLANFTMLDELYEDTSMLGKTGESFLSDSRGVALTPLRYSSHTGMSHPIDVAAMKDCLLGNAKEFVITPDYMNEPTAMSYRPVKGYGGCIMVHLRASEIMAPVNAIRNMVAGVVLASLLGATLISALVVRKLLSMDKVRSRLEEDLARHLDTLEDEVARRTSELEDEVRSRTRAEERLRENKAFLENIITNVHEAIWTVDVSGGEFWLTWSNANAARMFGQKVMGSAGLTLKEAFGDDLGLKLAAHYSGCVEKGGVVNVEETFENEKGHRVCLVTLVPVKNEAGRIAEVIGSAMDITERKQLEGEIVKAQKLESLGVLAGGIAHDFNNLLAAIRLNVSILKNEPALGPESIEMLRLVESSTAMATNLTGQLLTFAKGGKPVKKSIPLAAFLRDVAGFSLRGTRAACSLRIAEDLMDIEADPGQMSQVLNNILINAGQSMPEGGKVALSAENVEVSGPQGGLPLMPGKYVKITIEDTGSGIPEEVLPRIFDPYFTTRKEGNGLGLASAYSIIKNHGGFITVSSSVGVGTRFEIYVPGLESKVAEKAEDAALGAASGGTVLVMDDDELVRRSVCRVLDALGYEYKETADGKAAVEQYEKALKEGNAPDAVILDLTVPAGMGGREAAAKILEIDPSAKLFVSSGYYEDPVIANYREYGFIGSLQKPYDAAELDKKLREVVNRKDA